LFDLKINQVHEVLFEGVHAILLQGSKFRLGKSADIFELLTSLGLIRLGLKIKRRTLNKNTTSRGIDY
jgi:hypothetical protein